MNIKRGNIYLANLNPTLGSEINKTRPVVVVSNDLNNEYNNIITVIPLTSNIRRVFKFEVLVLAGTGNLPKDSKIKVDQIRAIDKLRLGKEIGSLPTLIVEQL